MHEPLEKLVSLLARLPGVGKRSAERMTQALARDGALMRDLSAALRDAGATFRTDFAGMGTTRVVYKTVGGRLLYLTERFLVYFIIALGGAGFFLITAGAAEDRVEVLRRVPRGRLRDLRRERARRRRHRPRRPRPPGLRRLP